MQSVCGHFLTAGGVIEDPAAVGAIVGAIIPPGIYIRLVVTPVDDGELVRLWLGLGLRIGSGLGSGLRLGSGLGSGLRLGSGFDRVGGLGLGVAPFSVL